MKKLLTTLIDTLPREHRYRKHPPGRLLFAHLPKCAGMAVNHYLEQHYPPRLVFKTPGRRPMEAVDAFRQWPEERRHAMQLITGHGTHRLLDEVHPDTVALTIFRDPVERIVSHYYFVKEDTQHYLHDAVCKSGMSLEEYARSELSLELRNRYTTLFAGCSLDEAEADPSAALENALQVLQKRYALIGFQDQLSAILDRVQEQLHFGSRFKNRVVNKTRHRAAIEEIPESTRDLIAELNPLDVDLYATLRVRYSSDH